MQQLTIAIFRFLLQREIRWVICWGLLKTGLLAFSCKPKVTLLDLRCHLRWECHSAFPNSTYTVQTMGALEWEDIPGCVRISTDSCDLSHVFNDFDQHNLIRVSLNTGGKEHWSETVLCNLNSPGVVFSAPALSVSVVRQTVIAEVRFPCGPRVACDENDNVCCPVTEFYSVSAAVTLYSKHNSSDIQVGTKDAEFEKAVKFDFWNLAPGQEYCVVANYTFSQLSSPHCVRISAPNSDGVFALLGDLKETHLPLYLVLFVPVVVLCILLVKLKWSSEIQLPLILETLKLEESQRGDHSKAMFPQTPEEEDSLSFVSVHSFVFDRTTLDQEHGYYGSPALGDSTLDDPVCAEENGSSEGIPEGQDNGGGLLPPLSLSDLVLKVQERPPDRGQCPSGPLLAPDTSRILLSTVRFGGSEDETEWCHYPVEDVLKPPSLIHQADGCHGD